jgi:cobalt-zinc-cadmium efflux system protein
MRHHHTHQKNSFSPVMRRLMLALGITLAFVCVEALAGYLANSLALLSDAAHNLTDVAALALSYLGLHLATRPANAKRTFGYHRAGILIAAFNAASLVLITLWIFYEAYQRLVNPSEIRAGLMIVTSVAALIVNFGTAWLLRRDSHRDLNLHSAFVHLAGDALTSLGAILAGIGIAVTGIEALDPLASILIGMLILWNAWGILHESADILLESSPRGMDMDALVADIRAIPGVRGVHDLHVWSLNREQRSLSVHILIDDTSVSQSSVIQRQVNEMLAQQYAITHATFQLECQGCDPDMLYCDLNHEAG